MEKSIGLFSGSEVAALSTLVEVDAVQMARLDELSGVRQISPGSVVKAAGIVVRAAAVGPRPARRVALKLS